MINRVWRVVALVALMGPLLAGCPDRAARFDDSIGLIGPHLVQGRAVYLSRGRRAALILEPSTGSFTVAPLSSPPQNGQPVPGQPELAVLLSDAEVLEVIDTEQGGVTTFELGSAFDALSLSSDGGFALTSFAGGAAGVLSNAAEVAVVDLDAAPSDTNPTRRTVASAGGTPIGIDVSPPFGATGRRIALVRSINHLAALDLTQPTGATRSIPLVSPGSDATVVPQQIEFSVAGEILNVFIRVSGLNDVYHLRFDGNADVDGAPLPLLNQFAAGSAPSDIAVWPGESLSLLIVNAGSQDLTIINVQSAQAATVALDTPVDSILLYDGASGREALIYAAGGVSAQFHRVALGDLAVKKSKAVETRSLVSAIGEVEAVAGGAWFLVTHVGGNAAVTLVEGAGNRVMPFTGGGTVQDVAVAEDGSTIWVLSNQAGIPRLGVIDVASGHPESMDLNVGKTVSGLHRLADSDFLLVTRTDSLGALTLVRTSDVEAGLSTDITGFGLSGLLDEEDADK
ncbi:MAG: hypothetical protein ACI9WU_004318 [Myxococcota bacterium]|jgi:hypothetical protein